MGKGRHEQVVLSVRPFQPLPFRLTPPSAPVAAMSPSAFSSSMLAAATTAPDLVLYNAVTGAVLRQAQVLARYPSCLLRLHPTLCIRRWLRTRARSPHRTAQRELRQRRPESLGNRQLFLHHRFQVKVLSSSLSPSFLTAPRRGHDFPDPLVKVYDMRKMRPLPPIPFSDGPAFISLLPMHTSSLIVISSGPRQRR
jgi:PAB-dependent poly(A)-specific ribonuclease subunit 2